MKVPWALTVNLPSLLARLWQSKIPSIRSESAVLMVTKHCPASERNSSGEPSAPKTANDKISDAEVAILLVNEVPDSQTDRPASSTQSSEMLAGGGAQAPGGASVVSEKLVFMPPVTVTEALPMFTVEVRLAVGEGLDVSVELEVEAGADTEPIGEKTVGGGPRSLAACAHAPASTIAAAQIVIETLVRMARSFRGQTLTQAHRCSGRAGKPC